MILISRVNANTNQRASIIKQTPKNQVDRITWPVSILDHSCDSTRIYKVDIVVGMESIHGPKCMALTHQGCHSYC